jgi:Putative transposase/Transposase zinc-binding domain
VEIRNRTTLAGKPKFEVSDILRSFGHSLEFHEKKLAKVVRDIENCRTAVLGGHKLECDGCNAQEYSYNSCRNRHCPKCQFLTKAKWIEARKSELLPIEYFHMVFTIAHILNLVIWENKKIGYDILFRAVSETIKEVAESRLGAKVGFTSVLHTWSQKLLDHAHIHVIVPGGGLSEDGTKWISAKTGFFLPIKILSKVFRGKFLSFLEKAHSELSLTGENEKYKNKMEFKSLLISAAEKDWVVYAKAPFAGPNQVLDYLGNYTHRIAISNHRIENFDGEIVTIKYKDRENGNVSKAMELHGAEFTKRFLSHVLPNKFVRIRHYGMLGSRGKEKNMTRARELLKARKIEKVVDKDWQAFLKRIVGKDITICPHCKTGHLQKTTLLMPHINLQRKKRIDSS